MHILYICIWIYTHYLYLVLKKQYLSRDLNDENDLRKDLSSQKLGARKARQRLQVRNELGKFEEQKEN